jgi:hypothetical protein
LLRAPPWVAADALQPIGTLVGQLLTQVTAFEPLQA